MPLEPGHLSLLSFLLSHFPFILFVSCLSPFFSSPFFANGNSKGYVCDNEDLVLLIHLCYSLGSANIITRKRTV